MVGRPRSLLLRLQLHYLFSLHIYHSSEEVLKLLMLQSLQAFHIYMFSVIAWYVLITPNSTYVS